MLVFTSDDAIGVNAEATIDDDGDCVFSLNGTPIAYICSERGVLVLCEIEVFDRVSGISYDKDDKIEVVSY